MTSKWYEIIFGSSTTASALCRVRSLDAKARMGVAQGSTSRPPKLTAALFGQCLPRNRVQLEAGRYSW